MHFEIRMHPLTIIQPFNIPTVNADIFYIPVIICPLPQALTSLEKPKKSKRQKFSKRRTQFSRNNSKTKLSYLTSKTSKWQQWPYCSIVTGMYHTNYVHPVYTANQAQVYYLTKNRLARGETKCCNNKPWQDLNLYYRLCKTTILTSSTTVTSSTTTS